MVCFGRDRSLPGEYQPTNLLSNTKWKLLGYGDETGTLVDSIPVAEPHTITVTFGEDSVLADLPINSLHSTYRIVSDTLLMISNLTFTEAIGLPGEQKFIHNFPRDTCRYTLTADRLVLFPMSINNQGKFVDDQPSVYQKMD